ncbi:MAG: AmmeMemoRadiSam system protein B [Desulfobacterales bacterium]|nr:AmmeMemoRadiSam system protein B [Desulfobacterales bacterium]MBL7101478.1 AmmeMemoRadiSam system protein B [Desulfobacteraceae bacterium]MBL7171805.1 AmmeMemoRadiSam system protein B [Desulfobacteraceae bacterium]MBU0990798.1 AmmeMemoRadiSam system protein B [Pseudomonadota bacterium]
MTETRPMARRDLEFFPVQHKGQQFVLIRDPLGLVEEGKAVGIPLYQLMMLLDGTTGVRDLQMELMRQKGGVLVGTDEIDSLLAHLDESFLLDSERFQNARDRIITQFTSEKIRPCSHCGKSYPENRSELRLRIDEILNSQPPWPEPKGKVVALIAPHIDLNVGYKGYSTAYQMVKHTSPSRIILLGVGHQLQKALFSLTDKDFETPLGITQSEQETIRRLREAGQDIIAVDDFIHRSEHSIEFQLIFLQHLIAGKDFTIIPILCGFLQAGLPEYSRGAYLEHAGRFLDELRLILKDPDQETLLVAGVDFSHTGPKFGHEMPASYLQSRSEEHDRNLLIHLTGFDADSFWEESRRVNDQFNVCGFSALACLLEVLPECQGELLNYEIWHEAPTRSAVSFASVVFTS